MKGVKGIPDDLVLLKLLDGSSQLEISGRSLI